MPLDRTPQARQLNGHLRRRKVAGQAEDQRGEIVARSVVSRTLSPRDQTIATRIGALEQVGYVCRCGPRAVAVIQDEVDELREQISWLVVRPGGDALERERRIGRRPQGHQPLHRPLEFKQEQDSLPFDGRGGPDHVGMTSLERLFADEPGGCLTQRREVDLGRPLGRVAADEDLRHAAVGEDGLEEGVVHGVSGLVGTPRWGKDVGAWMAGWANLR